MSGFFAMNNPPTPKPSLPHGETDPNQLYNAVGRAIHAWENMETALARLYATMTGLPENPVALADYGSENRRFVDRLSAISDAAAAYFIGSPDQHREGELSGLLKDAKDLSIKRHRVAHGFVTMWTEFPIPPDAKGAIELQAKVLFRWGAPFYSMTNLRTDPVGGDAASIEAVQKEFEDLHNRIAKFISELPKRP
jgi:hypothetical protein